jgi:hypothetical protein
MAGLAHNCAKQTCSVNTTGDCFTERLDTANDAAAAVLSTAYVGTQKHKWRGRFRQEFTVRCVFAKSNTVLNWKLRFERQTARRSES